MHFLKLFLICFVTLCNSLEYYFLVTGYRILKAIVELLLLLFSGIQYIHLLLLHLFCLRCLFLSLVSICCVFYCKLFREFKEKNLNFFLKSFATMDRFCSCKTGHVICSEELFLLNPENFPSFFSSCLFKILALKYQISKKKQTNKTKQISKQNSN